MSITRGNNQTKPFPGYKPAKVIGFNFNFCNSFKLIGAAAATVCGCPFPEGIEQKRERINNSASRTQRLIQELSNVFSLSKTWLAISSTVSPFAFLSFFFFLDISFFFSFDSLIRSQSD